MPQKPYGRAIIEMPKDLDVVITREFEAPIALVFDVLTKPEHVSKWFAPFECEITECSIDLRAGSHGWAIGVILAGKPRRKTATGNRYARILAAGGVAVLVAAVGVPVAYYSVARSGVPQQAGRAGPA